MDYSRFQNVYANLPSKLRKEIVVVIEGEPFTWNAAYSEVVNQTELGKKILEKLIRMEII